MRMAKDRMKSRCTVHNKMIRIVWWFYSFLLLFLLREFFIRAASFFFFFSSIFVSFFCRSLCFFFCSDVCFYCAPSSFMCYQVTKFLNSIPLFALSPCTRLAVTRKYVLKSNGFPFFLLYFNILLFVFYTNAQPIEYSVHFSQQVFLENFVLCFCECECMCARIFFPLIRYLNIIIISCWIIFSCTLYTVQCASGIGNVIWWDLYLCFNNSNRNQEHRTNWRGGTKRA